MKKCFVMVILLISALLLAKGECLPSSKGEPASAVLDLSVLHKVASSTDEQKDGFEDMRGERDWETMKYEGFEGAWPNDWDCYSSSDVDCYWSDDSNNSSVGSWSGWCADGGSNSPSEQIYPDDMHSWMVYGPFSLADASNAKLWYDVWYETESNFDYFKVMASLDGDQFWGLQWNGDSEGWAYNQAFDLTDVYELGDVTGENQVWIAFIFTSDGSVGYEGAYVDEVELMKDYDPPVNYAAPNIYSVSVEDYTDANYNGYYEEVWFEVDVDAVLAGRATNRAENCYIEVYSNNNGAFLGSWGPFAFNDMSTSDNVIIGPVDNATNWNATVDLRFVCSNWLGEDTEIETVDMEAGYVDEDEDMITKTNNLIGNYPNPFNPSTAINYNLAAAGQASLKIFNVKGELVKTLVNSVQDAGSHTVNWDGFDNSGNKAASGIYYYQLKTAEFSASKRMIMLK